MKYIRILTSIIFLGLSLSAFAQDEVPQNAKVTDRFSFENDLQPNSFFKQSNTLGLSPILKLGGEEYTDSERNFTPRLTLNYAGDVNGDGYDDFYYIVTTPDETTDDLEDQVIKTIILHGTPTGIDVENSVIIRDGYTFLADLTGDGQPESIQFIDGTLYLIIDNSNGEYEVVTEISLLNMAYNGEYRAHGDFDGDGFNDLMVYKSSLSAQDTTDNYIIYGTDDVANIAIDTLKMSASGIGSSTEYFQMAYSDIDGDGTTEVVKVMSGTNSDNIVYGAITIYQLNGTGELEMVSQDTLWEHFELGYSMTNGTIGLSDLNGDGSEELHVDNEGILTIYQLSADTTLSFDVENPIATYEVNGFSSLGDFDDNGSEELLIYSNAFVKYLSFDSNFDITETDLPMQDGDYVWPSQSVTEDVNSSGDVNGDGIRDLVLGFQNSEAQRYGYRVHFGNSSGNLADTATTVIDYPIIGDNSTVRYVFNAGDFNNDGIDDFGIVYASGLVELYFGGLITEDMDPDLSFKKEATVFSPSVGDINGDGVDDLLISHGTSGIDANDAAINIYLGGSSPDLTADYTINFSDIYPDTTGGAFGNAQFIGDINNDGYDDLMFATEYLQDVAHIIYGGTSISSTSDEQLPYFPINFSKLGDFNGDGLADYAVANNSNVVFIYSGYDASNGESFSDVPMLELPAPVYNGIDQFGSYSFYGHTLTSGDFNGDSLADLAFTSVFHEEFIDNVVRPAEAIRIYTGSTTPDTLVDGKIYLRTADYDLFPATTMDDTLSRNLGSLSVVPDQNGDGMDELLFANYGWGTNAGVYYGGKVDTMGNAIDVYLEAPNQRTGLGPHANYIYAGRGIPAVGDFNNDGKNEYLLPQTSDQNFITDPVYMYSSDQFSVSNEEELSSASEFKLHQNYPNPFNPTTKISYRLPVSGDVKLEVFDITGRLVSTIVNEEMTAGTYTHTFDASALASGMYIYRLKSSGFTQVKKMMLIK